MQVQTLWMYILLILTLAACGTASPMPAASATPGVTQTVVPSPSLSSTPAEHPSPSLAATQTPSPSPAPNLPIISQQDLNNLQVLTQWQTEGWNEDFAWSPEGTKLLYFTDDDMRLIDPFTQKIYWTGKVGYSADFSRDGKHIVVGYGDGISILDASNGNMEKTTADRDCLGANLVRFSPDGEQVAAAGQGSIIYLLDAQNFNCKTPFQTLTGIAETNQITPVNDMLFSPDGKVLVVVTEDQVIFLGVPDGKEISRLPGSQAVFHPNGRWLAVQNADGLVLYDWATQKPLRTFPIYGGQSVSFSPDGNLLVAASQDGSDQQLNFYDVQTGDLTNTYRNLPSGVLAVSFNPTRNLVLVLTGKSGLLEMKTFNILGSGETPGPSVIIRGSVTPGPWTTLKPLQQVTLQPPLFPLLSHSMEYQQSAPTPISTPPNPVQTFRLKDWSSKDAVDLIRDMVVYAHASDLGGPAFSRPDFTIMQSPIRLAALEYLQRFPNSPDDAAVRWRLAFSDAILGSPDSDSWIAAQIEQGLNNGTIDPQNMNPSLTPYGFSVNLNICPISADCGTDETLAVPLIVSTLLGDGGKTQIIQVNTVEDVTGSMLMAIHQNPQGRFYVIPVHSGWSARYGNSLKVSIQDLTGDGQPEIWVDEHTLSGTIFFQKAYIYHWTGVLGRGGRFDEVLNGQISGYFEKRAFGNLTIS